MLSENEATGLANELRAFSFLTNTHHNNLQSLLVSHDKLLRDYKSLLSDYEETKEARDRYKRAACTTEGTPFIAVLIDGDHYLFEDHLVKAGADGGAQAARMINAAFTDQIRKLGLPNETKLLVRYITNLAETSTLFHRLHVLGSHARALAPFAAGFAKSYPLFDVVESGEKPGTTASKLQENFLLFAESTSCRHIFFAGCNTMSHLNLLSLYERKVDKVTLIRNSKSLIQYSRLGLRSEELSGLFKDARPDILEKTAPRLPPDSPPVARDQPITAAPASKQARRAGLENDLVEGPHKAVYDAGLDRLIPRDNEAAGSPQQEQAAWVPPSKLDKKEKAREKHLAWQAKRDQSKTEICAHWIRGQCKFGEACIKRHETPIDPRGPGLLDGYGSKDRAAVSHNWRQPDSPTGTSAAAHEFDKHDAGGHQPSLDARERRDMVRESTLIPVSSHERNARTSASQMPGAWATLIDFKMLSNKLPKRNKAKKDRLPVDRMGWRLDYPPEMFTLQDAADLDRRRARIEPCHDHYLHDGCRNGTFCKLDHSPMSPGMINALRYLLRETPCTLLGHCRDLKCPLGHVCFSIACREERADGCRYPYEGHFFESQAAGWLPSDESTENSQDQCSNEGDLLGGDLNDEDQASSGNKSLGTAQWTDTGLGSTRSGGGNGPSRSQAQRPSHQQQGSSQLDGQIDRSATPLPIAQSNPGHPPAQSATGDPFWTSPVQLRDKPVEPRPAYSDMLDDLREKGPRHTKPDAELYERSTRGSTKGRTSYQDEPPREQSWPDPNTIISRRPSSHTASELEFARGPGTNYLKDQPYWVQQQYSQMQHQREQTSRARENAQQSRAQLATHDVTERRAKEGKERMTASGCDDHDGRSGPMDSSSTTRPSKGPTNTEYIKPGTVKWHDSPAHQTTASFAEECKAILAAAAATKTSKSTLHTPHGTSPPLDSSKLVAGPPSTTKQPPPPRSPTKQHKSKPVSSLTNSRHANPWPPESSTNSKKQQQEWPSAADPAAADSSATPPSSKSKTDRQTSPGNGLSPDAADFVPAQRESGSNSGWTTMHAGESNGNAGAWSSSPQEDGNGNTNAWDASLPHERESEESNGPWVEPDKLEVGGGWTVASSSSLPSPGEAEREEGEIDEQQDQGLENDEEGLGAQYGDPHAGGDGDEESGW